MRASADAPPRSILLLLRLNNLGGAELSMLRIADGLHARGYSVRVAAYGAQRRLLAEKYPQLAAVFIAAQGSLSSLLPLAAILRRERPAVLIAALSHTNLLAMAAAALAGGDTRVVVTEHNPLSPDFLGTIGWRHRCLRPLIGCFYPFAAAIVAVSQGIAADIGGLLRRARPVQVIHNPVLREEAAAAPAPHPWLADSSVPVVMAMGRLSPEKDFATLLRAFAQLAAHHPARLVILGEGQQRAELELLAQSLGVADRLLMPGFVDKVFDWLPHARVFVSSSRYEGFGNAIVEAMAAGVPVIVTDCPVGPAEILAGGKWGRLIPPGDAAAMAQAIEAVLDAPPDTQGARKRAQEFTQAHCVDAYVRLIEALP